MPSDMAANYRGRRILPDPADIMLVIEMSNSSYGYDRMKKIRAYARAGIAEFWIVHLAERRVIRFRDPHGDSYRSEEVFGAGESLAPSAFPNDTIAVDQILP